MRVTSFIREKQGIFFYDVVHGMELYVIVDGQVGYGWVNGLLEIFPYTFCPHYNERGEILDSMIGEQTSPCLALDNNVAFVDQDGCISYVASDNSSKAYVLNYVDGMLNKQEQIVKIL